MLTWEDFAHRSNQHEHVCHTSRIATATRLNKKLDDDDQWCGWHVIRIWYIWREVGSWNCNSLQELTSSKVLWDSSLASIAIALSPDGLKSWCLKVPTLPASYLGKSHQSQTRIDWSWSLWFSATESRQIWKFHICEYGIGNVMHAKFENNIYSNSQ